jgi:hypothetical protein
MDAVQKDNCASNALSTPHENLRIGRRCRAFARDHGTISMSRSDMGYLAKAS